MSSQKLQKYSQRRQHPSQHPFQYLDVDLQYLT